MSSDRRTAGLAGLLLVLGYCFINSTKSVLEGALVQDLSPEFIAFNSFVLAQAFYFITLRGKRELWAVTRRLLPDVVMLNISTAVCWIAVLYAFTVFEPAMANSLIIGLGPAITIALGFKLRPGTKAVPLELAAAAGMLVAMGYLLVTTADGSSAIGDLSAGQLAFGVVTCVLTSVSLAGVTYYTKRLGDAGMTVRQMMSSRFVVLIVATLVLLGVRDSFAPYSAGNVGAILVIGVVGVVISLYLLQQGIVRTEPITVSMLFGMNLIITFVTQFLDPRLDQSWNTFTGIVLISAAMLVGTWGRYRADRQAAAAAPDAEAGARGAGGSGRDQPTEAKA